MYLKSIEVNGFKSFANKILFNFNDGITGIVGPNGSGKSNVADAVRWVLGEQSAKQLRGSKMEDVIFSGTELRKAQSSAYVAITLDNSDHSLPIDFTEVKVARRVFRSGESEYLINGSPCRLKDIQELFFDTGIGKEGYSIIGQGQIEKILSGKPEERRELFDEAAGIVKYKKRKKQAEKSLEEERNNLSRVTDILNEIEHQLTPLEKQSTVAKEYLLLRDKLKSLDINMFLMEYDRIHDEEKIVLDKLSIATGNIEEAKDLYESTKAEYQSLEEELESLNTNIDEYQNSLSENKIKCEQLDGSIKVINEQISSHTINSQHFESRVGVILDEINAKEQELSAVKTQLAENDNQLTALDEKKVELDNQYMDKVAVISQLSEEIDTLNQEMVDILHDNSEKNAALERNSAILEQNNIKKAGLNQKLLQQKSDEAVATNKVEDLEKKVNDVNSKIEGIISKNNQIKIKEEQIQKDIDKNKSNLQSLNQEVLQSKSRLESLRNITERYDGYGNSIKKVMEQKGKIKGIVGVVADIVKSEKKYETAIEIALGGSIQNIVTEDENTAKRLIEFLKVNRFGRATFLPLTAMSKKNSFNNPDALKEKGAIATADKLISRDSKFDDLIVSLVGRVLVVDNIDNAISIAKKYNNTIRIVTLEGELLNPGGSMSGGAYKNSSNLLGRRRELEELENEIKSKSEKHTKINEKLAKLREERGKCRELIENNLKLIQEFRISKSALDVNFTQAKAELENLKNTYGDISDESRNIGTLLKELNLKIEDLKKNISKNNEKYSLNKESIAAKEKDVEAARVEENKINSQLSQIGMDYSGLEKARQYISENHIRLDKEIEKLKEEQVQIQSSIDGSDDYIKEKEAEIAMHKSQIDSLNEIINELNDKLVKSQQLKKEINEKHKSFFSKREELSEKISMLDKEIFRLNNQKERLSDSLDNFVSYMWEEYEITYSSALPFKNEEYDNYNETKKLISEVKSKIKALGDVNVNAVEDYKNLLERYELLKTQHDDIVKSEEALMKIIDELDTEMRKQFEEKFEQIRVQFDIVFKQLFGGGKGTLELMEDEDILEAGIKIIAQPPGKKLQNMMQLSGGEKSLTAISLLFAIQNLKPSPFALLDEIEAALDDSNVKRFAQYLHKLTKNTQFIVITHRRGTMSAADVLYGITMQEKGVSTLVSVNLIEGELDK